jgi:hypothetical protein
MRRAITLASLILAIVVLIPASALAKSKGTNRPFKVTVSMTSVSNLETSTNHYEGTITGSHFGKGTIEGNGSFSFNEFGSFNYGDSFVITAANGDKLFGESKGTVTAGPEGFLVSSDVNVEQPITGGTGRFAGASGVLTGTYPEVVTSFEGPLLTFNVTGSTAGSISY